MLWSFKCIYVQMFYPLLNHDPSTSTLKEFCLKPYLHHASASATWHFVLTSVLASCKIYWNALIWRMCWHCNRCRRHLVYIDLRKCLIPVCYRCLNRQTCRRAKLWCRFHLQRRCWPRSWTSCTRDAWWSSWVTYRYCVNSRRFLRCRCWRRYVTSADLGETPFLCEEIRDLGIIGARIERHGTHFWMISMSCLGFV